MSRKFLKKYFVDFSLSSNKKVLSLVEKRLDQSGLKTDFKGINQLGRFEGAEGTHATSGVKVKSDHQQVDESAHFCHPHKMISQYLVVSATLYLVPWSIPPVYYSIVHNHSFTGCVYCICVYLMDQNKDTCMSILVSLICSPS